MLQFIAQENDRYSIPEQIQMAVEGGCKWVQLHVPNMDDPTLRELAREIVPLCKETSTILTIENHVEIAKELGIHGILLVDNVGSVAEIREFCGPEAILGVQVGVASTVVPMRHLDIDFVTFTPNMPIARLSENVEALREAEIIFPLVASGDYTLAEIPALLASRVNGIALGSTITDSADPVATTAEIIRLISPE